MYAQWKTTPDAVDKSWQMYFRNLEARTVRVQSPGFPSTSTSAQDLGDRTIADVGTYINVKSLVRAYENLGHLKADIDPLGQRHYWTPAPEVPDELEVQSHKLKEKDLGVEIDVRSAGILPYFTQSTRSSMPVRDIIAACEQIYCGTVAVEFAHIPNAQQRDWIRQRTETRHTIRYSDGEMKLILDRLLRATLFETFLATKYPNRKRYGLDGSETLVPGIQALVDTSVERHGVENLIIGSQHRGRLNLMGHLMQRPMEVTFYDFISEGKPHDSSLDGDVLTHLGGDCEREYPSGRIARMSLLPNPSHLEATNPVAAGKAKAIQHDQGDMEQSKSLFLNIHGDAAIAGQGIVYETMTLSKIPSFSVGGTIHVILNNQVGFTTDPQSSRSTTYCSDLAKTINAPIIHVNGDDVEAVVFACKLAADWRAQFKTDVFVDLVCYRKYGHNEIDQPKLTQPFMYDKIAHKLPAVDTYIQKLIRDKVLSKEEIQERKAQIWETLSHQHKLSKDFQPDKVVAASASGDNEAASAQTQISAETRMVFDSEQLKMVVDKSITVPENFTLHSTVKRVFDARQKSVSEGEVDWPTAEALAFGTLCLEGHHVRISGEDVERGTFSQRHAVVHNQLWKPGDDCADARRWTPLDHLSPDQARFHACNSPLSEFGVLGFEYGYSLGSPDSLVMWEAQFGDFANNAQVVIDQFIAGGATKWGQHSRLVLSLPHGYDGQGPEHSSARIERFLQLCNDDPRAYPSTEQVEQNLERGCNMRVAYPTTPANLFHLLRQQIHGHSRKPLVMFFSKSLLRHPFTRSPIEDFVGESRFRSVIHDSVSPAAVRSIILCSGQIYAALQKYRMQSQIDDDVALVRLEKLHPFPWSAVTTMLDTYHGADDVIWCQEEPMNGGAWSYVQPRLQATLAHSKASPTARM
ncbi:2-oxoglutarate dehydrogenase, mitochondrial [Fonsecaea pedrosoi]|nr:2-oxoglutarate dehydrogenase, mitochondrial [Fonsecaea pedrosoi]